MLWDVESAPQIKYIIIIIIIIIIIMLHTFPLSLSSPLGGPLVSCICRVHLLTGFLLLSICHIRCEIDAYIKTLQGSTRHGKHLLNSTLGPASVLLLHRHITVLP